jgi:hypothetical protein
MFQISLKTVFSLPRWSLTCFWDGLQRKPMFRRVVEWGRGLFAVSPSPFGLFVASS